VHLYIGFIGDNPETDGPASFEHMYKLRSWHHGERVGHRLYSTVDIYVAAKKLLHQASIDSDYGACASDSFGASGKNGTRGIKIPSSEYWTDQAKNIQEPSSVSDFVSEQAGRHMFRNGVKIMAVHVYGLENWDPEQLSIFDVEGTRVAGRGSGKVMAREIPFRSQEVRKRVSDAVDGINDRYGEFVITPAMMMEMQGTILDRIAFGSVEGI